MEEVPKISQLYELGDVVEFDELILYHANIIVGIADAKDMRELLRELREVSIST